MKKLTKNKKNIYVPAWSLIVAVLIFASQILYIVSAQNINTDPPQLESVERHERALSTKTDSTSEECPMCNLSEMPMELAEQINEISDVDEFIHDFVDSNSLQNVSAFTHPANRLKRAASTTLRQAICQPIDTLISLIPENERDPTVFYFPSCVVVKKCGGCCAHSGTICSPLDEVERQVTVKKTKFVPSEQNKLTNLGDMSVTIKEHNKCKCLCKKTAEDCNSLQKFIKNQCRCECLNMNEAGQCAQNPKKLFDVNSCACVCRDTKYCAPGTTFDQETCACKENPENHDDDTDEYYFGDQLLNETFEATDPHQYETVPAVTT